MARVARLATCEDRGLTGQAGESLRHARRAVEQDRTYIAMGTSKEKIAVTVFARFLGVCAAEVLAADRLPVAVAELVYRV